MELASYRGDVFFKGLSTDEVIKFLENKDSFLRNKAVIDLQLHGDESIVSKIIEAGKKGNYKTKEACAAILGYVSINDKQILTEVVNYLSSLAMDEKSIKARCSAISGLGLRYFLSKSVRQRIIPIFFMTYTDKNNSIRFATTEALGYVDNTKKVIKIIECLLRDTVGDIREWTAFYLQQTRLDSEGIRNALVELLSDKNDTVRYEAIYALVKLKDSRVLPALKVELEKDYILLKMLEAAGDYGDISLLPYVKRIVDDFKGSADEGERIAQKQYRRLKQKARRKK